MFFLSSCDFHYIWIRVCSTERLPFCQFWVNKAKIPSFLRLLSEWESECTQTVAVSGCVSPGIDLSSTMSLVFTSFLLLMFMRHFELWLFGGAAGACVATFVVPLATRHDKHGCFLCVSLLYDGIRWLDEVLTALSLLQGLQNGDGIRIPGTADPQCRGNPLGCILKMICAAYCGSDSCRLLWILSPMNPPSPLWCLPWTLTRTEMPPE